MKLPSARLLVILCAAALIVGGGLLLLALRPDLLTRQDRQPTPTTEQLSFAPTPLASPTSSPPLPPAPPPPSATPTASQPYPLTLVSQAGLLGYIEALTAIQPHSGWRNSASRGEAEALDYLARTLDGFQYLHTLGLELEHQSFRVFLSTELGGSHLELMVDGQKAEVPADALQAPYGDVAQTLRFDSDGVLNDSNPNPVVVEGPVVVIGSADQIDDLGPGDVQGKVVFLDYAVIDPIVNASVDAILARVSKLLDKAPGGLALVTRFSNVLGESHSTFVGEGGALAGAGTGVIPPALYVRLEDLTSAGIKSWEDLERIQSARLTRDADVFSPASSGNLVARIPGRDTSQAMILGAHADSTNNPGAMDDGSGIAVLLEVARVLDAAQMQPPIDLYLAWFGSEEAGLYGSAHFANTHQELLDRTVGMLQIDCLTRPLDGITAALSLSSLPSGSLGESQTTLLPYLARLAEGHGLNLVSADTGNLLFSDNASLAGFDVLNADLAYVDEARDAAWSLHYSGHLHDPYDTLDLAREEGSALVQMAQVALTVALEPPQGSSALPVTPKPERRALIVASHTEAVHMTPAAFTQFGLALARAGYDVDLIPYGQRVITADLQAVDLVVALPVVDYPSSSGDPGLYDEAWSPEEIAALEAYVEEGGLLVVTNSAHSLAHLNTVLDANEDWEDANALASRFGVVYQKGILSVTWAQTQGSSPLVAGIGFIKLVEGNTIPLSLAQASRAEVLATAEGTPVVALVGHGQGQVLALADLGILGEDAEGLRNLVFWNNLARYARR